MWSCVCSQGSAPPSLCDGQERARDEAHNHVRRRREPGTLPPQTSRPSASQKSVSARDDSALCAHCRSTGTTEYIPYAVIEYVIGVLGLVNVAS